MEAEDCSFGAEIYPDVFAFATPEDTLVAKSGYSAFWETSALLDILRARGVDEVYYCGVASGT